MKQQMEYSENTLDIDSILRMDSSVHLSFQVTYNR